MSGPFAKLLSKSSTHILPGKLAIKELFFEVPLNYTKPSSGTLQLFARSVDRHTPTTSQTTSDSTKKPWLVYLQGGPGGACPQPESFPLTDIMLDRGYKLLYLDQRGTGLSTPISAATLALQGTPSDQATYLTNFRADNIVRDCEAVRKTLLRDLGPDRQKWSILGQSFGGFCALSYLSFHSEGLEEVFTLGGLAPLSSTASEVYEKTYSKLIERNGEYYKKYPEDVRKVHEICTFISSQSNGGIPLPTGGLLTLQRFLSMGIVLGFHGGIDNIHNQILQFSTDIDQFGFITYPTLCSFESKFLPLDRGVIYGVLHEQIYNQGKASNWAAHNVGLGLKEFQWLRKDWNIEGEKSKWRPLFFSGEMIYPFMFETYPELKKLQEVAEILAKWEEWPALYDLEKLAKNEVPVYSATFTEDLYVSYPLAMETAKRVKGCKQFVTNLLYHNALGAHCKEVMDKLFELRDDCID